jgi:hypothetical protein
MIFLEHESFRRKLADIRREGGVVVVILFAGTAGHDQNHVFDLGVKGGGHQKTTGQSRRSTFQE